MPYTVSQAQLLQIVFLFAAALMILLAPLIPALLIHRLLPDNKMDLKGPLNGLSIKAGGGIASYLAIFMLFSAVSLANVVPAISRLDDGQWQFNIPFVVEDSKGTRQILPPGGALEIENYAPLNPDYRGDDGVIGYTATVYVTPINDKLPQISLMTRLPGMIAKSRPIDLDHYAAQSPGQRTIDLPMAPLRADATGSP